MANPLINSGDAVLVVYGNRAVKIHRNSCCTTMHPHVVQLYNLMSYVHSNDSCTT